MLLVLLVLLGLLVWQIVIGMAVRAGMLFAALSLAKTSPHRQPVEMLLVRIQLRCL